MKVEVNEKDVVKHWGIWHKIMEKWLVDEDGTIISFTCPRVANAQHDIIMDSYMNYWDEEDLEVREIE